MWSRSTALPPRQSDQRGARTTNQHSRTGRTKPPLRTIPAGRLSRVSIVSSTVGVSLRQSHLPVLRPFRFQLARAVHPAGNDDPMHVICMHMVALQIRDVPEDVRDTLVDRARSQGQSLQSYLLSLVEAEARRSKNRAVLARFAGRSDGSKGAAGDTADELRDLREERDHGIGDC